MEIKGVPIKSTWNITDEYMYGADLLVAPVCHEHAMSRIVYLPEGTSWKGYFDRKLYEGGQYVEFEAPLDVIPVFERE